MRPWFFFFFFFFYKLYKSSMIHLQIILEWQFIMANYNIAILWHCYKCNAWISDLLLIASVQTFVANTKLTRNSRLQFISYFENEMFEFTVNLLNMSMMSSGDVLSHLHRICNGDLECLKMCLTAISISYDVIHVQREISGANTSSMYMYACNYWGQGSGDMCSSAVEIPRM